MLRHQVRASAGSWAVPWVNMCHDGVLVAGSPLLGGQRWLQRRVVCGACCQWWP
jgi:hypothetical protein